MPAFFLGSSTQPTSLVQLKRKYGNLHNKIKKSELSMSSLFPGIVQVTGNLAIIFQGRKR